MLCRTESRRFTHTTQGSTTELQKPQPGSQSVMQAHNSPQAQGEGINHLQPEKDWSTP